MKKAGARTIQLNQLTKALVQSGYEINLKRASCKVRGLIIPDQNEIFINQLLPINERVITILHEMIHLYDAKLDEDETEATAQAIFANLSTAELGYLEFLVA